MSVPSHRQFLGISASRYTFVHNVVSATSLYGCFLFHAVCSVSGNYAHGNICFEVLIVIWAHFRQRIRKSCDVFNCLFRYSTRKSPSVRDGCSEHFHPNQPETQRYAHRSLPNVTCKWPSLSRPCRTQANTLNGAQKLPAALQLTRTRRRRRPRCTQGSTSGVSC